MGTERESESGAVMRLRIFPLALLIVTDAMPAGVAGDARGPVVRIHPDMWTRGDEGLLQHELEHVRQFYRMWILSTIVNAPLAGWLALHFASPLSPLQAALAVGISCLAMHPLLYLRSRTYRELAEVDAYRVQMRYPDGKGGQLSLDDAAARLAGPRYGLGITAVEAGELLAG